MMAPTRRNPIDGDLVSVKRNSPHSPGDKVVTVVDNAMTVKTLRREADGTYWLETANAAYSPIRPKSSLEILDVVRASADAFRGDSLRASNISA